MIQILPNPQIGEAAELIKKGIIKRESILIVGNCWVSYEGRASSRLEPGERVVLIKEDGALLVHRSTGYEPINWMPGGNIVYHTAIVKPEENSQGKISVNWQPPGCIFHSRAKEGVLLITAIRRAPAESLRIHFNGLYLIAALKLRDTGEFSLYASEEDMQKAVLMKPSLIERGFKPVSFEKKVAPGFVDVYGIDSEGKLVVVEIKRKAAGRNAALQLSRYVKAVERSANREVRGVLAAPDMTKGTQKLLATLDLAFKPLDPRKCAQILRESKIRKLADFF
jgi:RecB family endonuclease NucS